MLKCPMCDYDNTAENKYCSQCGYRLENGADSRLSQALYTIRTANLKFVIGAAVLLTLIFAAGFGLANNALSLALGVKQDSPAATMDNAANTQPLKNISLEQINASEDANQEGQAESQAATQEQSQKENPKEEDQEEDEDEDDDKDKDEDNGKKKGQAKKKIDYENYTNQRFGFSIDYPQHFAKTEPPANGDGMVFTSPDGHATLMAFGSNKPKGYSLQDLYQTSKNSTQAKITYQKVGGSYFVLSWKKDNSVYYLKTFVGQDSTNTFIFSYPQDEKPYYDPITIHLEPSFKPGSLQQAAGNTGF